MDPDHTNRAHLLPLLFSPPLPLGGVGSIRTRLTCSTVFHLVFPLNFVQHQPNPFPIQPDLHRTERPPPLSLCGCGCGCLGGWERGVEGAPPPPSPAPPPVFFLTNEILRCQPRPRTNHRDLLGWISMVGPCPGWARGRRHRRRSGPHVCSAPPIHESENASVASTCTRDPPQPKRGRR